MICTVLYAPTRSTTVCTNKRGTKYTSKRKRQASKLQAGEESCRFFFVVVLKIVCFSRFKKDAVAKICETGAWIVLALEKMVSTS
jgi:hypothetical protein